MRTPPKQQVFAIYSRKSKFIGKGESIENQIEMCRQYISRSFGQEQADNALVYEDEGFSGGSTKRPSRVLCGHALHGAALVFAAADHAGDAHGWPSTRISNPAR